MVGCHGMAVPGDFSFDESRKGKVLYWLCCWRRICVVKGFLAIVVFQRTECNREHLLWNQTQIPISGLHWAGHTRHSLTLKQSPFRSWSVAYHNLLPSKEHNSRESGAGVEPRLKLREAAVECEHPNPCLNCCIKSVSTCKILENTFKSEKSVWGRNASPVLSVEFFFIFVVEQLEPKSHNTVRRHDLPEPWGQSGKPETFIGENKTEQRL